MTQDRPILGIALMFGFCLVAPLGDALTKLLSTTMPLGFLLLMRFSIQGWLLAPLILITGRPWRMNQRVVRLTAIRTALHISGIGGMIIALKYLPLADAIAIAFVMPFIMLLLGHFVLGEEVGMRRIIACAVGFCGTLLVIQPSFRDVGWPALLPLFVAITFAFFMLVTRQIAKDTDPIGLQFVSGFMAMAILIPAMVLGGVLDIDLLRWPSPTGQEWLLLAVIGVLGTSAHLCMTWSLRYAPAATLAPMQYLEIPVATVFGYLIFHDLPNGLAAWGICITIVAGLYIIMRERAIALAKSEAERQAPA